MAALLALTAATSAQAATIFGVDELNNLVTIDSGNPAITTSSRAITGVTNSIQALDFRPLDNMLYGLGTDRVVYTINTATGVASAVSGVLNLTGTEFGFDFNPTIDRLRIVSNSNDNYVFNPNDGSLTTATPVFYAAGDANVGANPDVTALAYTSSTFGAAAASTQLYAIDTALDVLTRQANSAGTLNTVGSLGTNVGARTSFDIAGSDAFALNGRTLYNVNLATGALSQVGLVDRSLFGIAIAAVPEPGTWALMLTGFGLTAFALRRRRGVTTRVRFA
ncbi:hypothetical protein ASG67_11410 [Sphingomonas sp. Leaf339]|nr:hypothetical protein ASG67_11410 [Sphingomonas sp. Leaf339]